MIYKPIGNRILVELEKQDASVGGIYVPDRVRKNSNIGKVVEVGTGKFNHKGILIPWTVEIGDTVIVEPTLDMITVQYGEKECAIFRQEEVIGVIK
jgi:chaperonin GroES